VHDFDLNVARDGVITAATQRATWKRLGKRIIMMVKDANEDGLKFQK
jgi:hypothetical protein